MRVSCRCVWVMNLLHIYACMSKARCICCVPESLQLSLRTNKDLLGVKVTWFCPNHKFKYLSQNHFTPR